MKMSRTQVGFVAQFPTDAEEEAVGRELAEYIAQQLKLSGISGGYPSDGPGWAWELKSMIDDVAIYSVIGFVDDMESTPPRQWLIGNDTGHAGFIQRLFRPSSIKKQDEALNKFCQILHRIISGDSRFTHVTWYNKTLLDHPGDQP